MKRLLLFLLAGTIFSALTCTGFTGQLAEDVLGGVIVNAISGMGT